MQQFTVPLSKLIGKLNIGVVYMPEESGEILISSADINRPGLQLVGFFEYFDNKRIQLMGKSEMTFLSQQSPEVQEQALEKFFAATPVAVIISRNFSPTELVLG